MSDERIPRAVWEGTIEIGGVTLRVAVLDTGARVINVEDVERLFAAETPITPAEAERFARWVRGEN